MLPPRVPKKRKRATRWKSTAHRDFVRSFACCMCGSTAAREAAHVRIGSGAGLGEKPDDWRVVSLCVGPGAAKDGTMGCHNRQHIIGERTFWKKYEQAHGQTVEQLIVEFIQASPRRRDIEAIMREREDA